MRFWLAFLLLISFSCCKGKSIEHFQKEGQEHKQELIEALQRIENLDDMIRASPQLKAIFDDLARLIIQARCYQIKTKTQVEISSEDRKLNQELRDELNRLYRMEGVQELMEKCQMSALIELDAFEKKTSKITKS
jgi:hypothetical protein